VLLLALLSVASAMLLRALGLGLRRRGGGLGCVGGTSVKVRAQVEALPLCNIKEVERQLPALGGYDCTLSRPLSVGRPVRLEARVEGPIVSSSGGGGDVCGSISDGQGLVTPLTQKACVLYSAAAFRRRYHSGLHPVPLAFTSRSIDFAVSLADAPEVCVEVRGEDLALFDMELGRFEVSQDLTDAPGHWQDFVRLHRAASAGDGPGAKGEKGGDSGVLEFYECALLVGSTVTLVGDLHRGATGQLSLWPWQGDACQAAFDPEPWRTSWERPAWQVSGEAGGNPPEVQVGKVLASDDPSLISACS